MLARPNLRGCVIFCILTFLFMNGFCHSRYSKCSKKFCENNEKGLISLKLTEKYVKYVRMYKVNLNRQNGIKNINFSSNF